jgi:hypothetical protein
LTASFSNFVVADHPDHAACAVLVLAVKLVLLALALAARTQTPRRPPIAVAP